MAEYGKGKGGGEGRWWVGDVSRRGMKHEFGYLVSARDQKSWFSLVF
jgi:hypothetical protein